MYIIHVANNLLFRNFNAVICSHPIIKPRRENIMNRVTAKSALKALVVTTIAIIGLQGTAFAATGIQTAPAVDGKHALVQEAGKTEATRTTSAPLQVATRLKNGLRINTACDDTGLPCPPRG